MRIAGIRCLLTVVAATSLCLCSCSRGVTVSVYNPTETTRSGQVVEIDASPIMDRIGPAFSVMDAEGNPVISH